MDILSEKNCVHSFIHLFTCSVSISDTTIMSGTVRHIAVSWDRDIGEQDQYNYFLHGTYNLAEDSDI